MKSNHTKLLTAIMIFSFIGAIGPCYAVLFGAQLGWTAALIMVPCSLLFTVTLSLLKK